MYSYTVYTFTPTIINPLNARKIPDSKINHHKLLEGDSMIPVSKHLVRGREGLTQVGHLTQLHHKDTFNAQF